MNFLESLLAKVSGLLRDRNQAWALIGGIAVSVRSEPRFTRDLDLAVAVADDREAEALVHGLLAAGFRALAIVEQEATHRLATARLAPSGDIPPGLMLDLLFASSGIEAEICAEAELLEVFPGSFVPVARIHHLLALKVLSRDDQTRPQDAVDLRQLMSVAHASDLTGALDAVRLIQARGFHRSRDLVQALRDAWHAFHG